MFGTMYLRELNVASRNLKVPATIFANNVILVFIAVFSYYVEFVSRGRLGQMVKGKEILNIYALISTIEFVFIIIAMLLLTVPGIMKERKNNTFDILVTTGVSTRKYLWAKLCSRVTIVMEVVVASCPIFGIVFYIGGVSVINIFEYYGILLVTAFYIGAIGILCASVCKRNITSTVTAYTLGFLVICGTLMIVAAFYLVKKVSLGLDINDFHTEVNLGGIRLLLLVNPLYNFMRMMNEQYGILNELLNNLSIYHNAMASLKEYWVLTSNLIQAGLTVLIVAYSARKLRYKKNKKAILK